MHTVYHQSKSQTETLNQFLDKLYLQEREIPEAMRGDEAQAW